LKGDFFNMADLKFKYGTTNINEADNDPGAIYV
jgi:hypothetical protein